MVSTTVKISNLKEKKGMLWEGGEVNRGDGTERRRKGGEDRERTGKGIRWGRGTEKKRLDGNELRVTHYRCSHSFRWPGLGQPGPLFSPARGGGTREGFGQAVGDDFSSKGRRKKKGDAPLHPKSGDKGLVSNVRKDGH
ncbi:hypothetical protein TNIN_92591 [Trichonephila inaurata madagascariensis]|uniref:Uncharacterized protein n=1 Tax=Trichonephila inaurata madagascariensis TaxID=2747483 RepID=A0A8X6YG81_9ARAC|nr:hypothetical protein TNIN_92591 [Trichonephila inaurata madagascariensis]